MAAVSAGAPAPGRAQFAAAVQVLLRYDGLDDGAPFASPSGYFGWQENSRQNPNGFDVYVLAPDGGLTHINEPNTVGVGGGIDGTTVVYSEARGALVHVRLYDLATGQRSDIPQIHSPAPDYHPTISGPWILFTRGDRRRHTEVLLFNRSTGEFRRLAAIVRHGRRGFVYSGQVAGDYAVWGRVTPHGQDVFRYDIAARTTTLLRRARGIFARYDPGVSPAGTVYFGQSAHTCRPPVRLVRQPLHGPAKVLGRLAGGVDAGYMYAVQTSSGTGVLYARFTYTGCETGGPTGPGAIYEIADRP